MNARMPCAAVTGAAAAPPPWLALRLAEQDRIRQQCASLKCLVRRIGQHGADADGLGAMLAGLGRAIQAALELHRSDQEADLFPALLESMAGSDAVCIRQMAAELTAEHRALDAQWRRTHAALDAALRDAGTHAPSAEVDALASLCERHLAFEEAELLPMAERLLSDPELARLAQTMAERREEP